MKKFLPAVLTAAVALMMVASCNKSRSDFAGPGTHWVVSLEESNSFKNNDTLPTMVYTYFNNLNYGYFGYEKDRSQASAAFDQACENVMEALADERLDPDTYVTLGLYMLTEDSSNPQEVKRTSLYFDIEDPE